MKARQSDYTCARQGVDGKLLEVGEAFLIRGGEAYERRAAEHLRFIFVTGDGGYDEQARSSFPA